MLRIENVGKSFGGLVAVSDCNITVEAGTITGLIGPNGAGKTTLFNMIAGTFPPTRGKIIFEGEDVTGLAPHELFAKGIVRTFQIPHEFAHMTTLENIMVVPPGQEGEELAATWFRWNRVVKTERGVRRRAEEVLEFLNLTHVRDERAGNLSGGQKKLLELGRTMMTEARIVLLDEPAAGVNRTLLRDLENNIRSLNKDQGITFFLIEHDMDLIAALCQPVICMAQGTVLTQGTFEEVRSNPAVLEAYLGVSEEAAGEARAQ
ncbi:MAG: ABC transporter ATP-binding protein [Planctomycetota bacterium]